MKTKLKVAASRPEIDAEEAINYHAIALEELSIRDMNAWEISAAIGKFYNKKQTKRRKPQWQKKQSNP
jgi:hypothetical protein